MPIEAEIRNQLVTLSELAGTKVTQIIANQGTTGTYITLTKVSGNKIASHEGRTGKNQARFQVSVWGDTYADAKNMAIKVYPLADYTSSAVAFIWLENEIDRQDNDNNKYGTLLDFIVQYYD